MTKPKFQSVLRMQPTGLMNADKLLLRIALKTADVYMPPVYQQSHPVPVDDLVERGLVTSEPAFGDERILRITPAGLAYAFEHLIEPHNHAAAHKEIAEWAVNVEDRLEGYRIVRIQENAYPPKGPNP